MSSVERQGSVPTRRSRTCSTDTKPSWLSPFHESFPAFNTHLMQRRSWNAAKPEVAYAATVLLANEKPSLQTHSLPRQCPETVWRHAGRSPVVQEAHSWPRGAVHDIKGHHCLWGCYFGVLLAPGTHLAAEGLWRALGPPQPLVPISPQLACTHLCHIWLLNPPVLMYVLSWD